LGQIVPEKGVVSLWEEATGRSTRMTTYNFKPWESREFCLGSVGHTYGTFAGGSVGVGWGSDLENVLTFRNLLA
jgi:hypothetical protein